MKTARREMETVIPCPVCDGTGKGNGESCPRCGGDGQVFQAVLPRSGRSAGMEHWGRPNPFYGDGRTCV